MKQKLIKMKIIGGASLLLILIVCSSVSAQNLQYAQNGVYFGAILPFNKLEGDFDGRSWVTDCYGEEAIVIPKIKNKSGFGFAVGVRSDFIGGELSYNSSQHDDDWMGLRGETKFNILNLDSKLFISTEQAFQPYLLLGLAYSWLIIQEGSVNYYYSSDDATLYGLGFNVGGGLALYLNPRLSIGGGVTYRYLEYSTMEGVSGETIELDDPVIGSGVSFNVGVTLTFK